MAGSNNIKKLIISGNKEQAIKVLRALKGLSYKEAQKEINAFEKKLISSGELTPEHSFSGIFDWVTHLF